MARTTASLERTPGLAALAQARNVLSGASLHAPPSISPSTSAQTASRAEEEFGKRTSPAFGWTTKAGDTLLRLRFDTMLDHFQGSKSSKQLAAAWRLLAAEVCRVSGLKVDPIQCKSKIKHMQKQFIAYQVPQESSTDKRRPKCYKAMCDAWGDPAEMGGASTVDPFYSSDSGEDPEDLLIEEKAAKQVERGDQDNHSGNEDNQGSDSLRYQRGKRNREGLETVEAERVDRGGQGGNVGVGVSETLRRQRRKRYRGELEMSEAEQAEHGDQDDNSGNESIHDRKRHRGKRKKEESGMGNGLRAIGSGLDSIAASLRLSKPQRANSDSNQTREIMESVKELTQAVHAQAQAINAQTQALNRLIRHLSGTGSSGNGPSFSTR